MTDYPSLDEARFETAGGRRIVYVRSILTADLPGEVQAQVEANLGLERIYAIHATSGEVLALAPDRRLAFALARQNEFAPVSVH